jgi:protoporphyrinogen/coproporphyrinogen III oxidase
MPLDAFGGLCPPKENRNVLGILFPSSMFVNRAPKEGALLSVFMGGMRNKELIQKTNEELVVIAQHEVFELLKTDKTPDKIHIHRYTHAIAQYTAHHELVYKTKQEIERQYPNFILAGGFIHGISMADRVKQAFEIADYITE